MVLGAYREHLDDCAMPAILLRVALSGARLAAISIVLISKVCANGYRSLVGLRMGLEGNIRGPGTAPIQYCRAQIRQSQLGLVDLMVQGIIRKRGLAFIYDVMDAPYLFLPYQPEGTSGLARRLNPFIHYIACR